MQHPSQVSSVVRHVKGSKGHLSQRVNCYASNAGTECDSLRGRLVDSQCHTQGSEVVVVGGVTTTQGDGKAVHRAKDFRFDQQHDTQMRTDKSLYHGNNNSCST